MFGQVLDKLSTWFGQGFLLSVFFPWLIFAVANLAMVGGTFASADAYLLKYLDNVAGNQALAIIGSLAAVGVGAYMSSPLLQVLTEILEGKYIPLQLVAEVLTRRQAVRLRRLAEQNQAFLLDRQYVRRLPNIAQRLREARLAGIAARSNGDPDAITRAGDTLRPLREKCEMNRYITSSELIAAAERLFMALHHNCSDAAQLRPSANACEIARSKKLGDLHRQMVNEVLPGARRIADRNFDSIAAERARLFATSDDEEMSADLQPTRLGNDAAALRSYCDTRYGFEFEFLWPRFLISIQKNSELSSAIVKAKIQLDFAVVLFWLTLLFVIVWLPLLTIYGKSLVVLLVVAGLAPFAATGSLRLVHASYSAFAEIVRSAIDTNRFVLLQALQRALPVSTQDEKIVWGQVVQLLRLAEKIDTTFKHPSS
jgi:hypothetical protein